MNKLNIECNHCKSNNIILNGWKREKQMCKCKDCNKSFQLDYTYNACKSEVKDEIINYIQNNEGIRKTARILKVNKKTVSKLKYNNLKE